jgi:hypothetical protein
MLKGSTYIEDRSGGYQLIPEPEPGWPHKPWPGRHNHPDNNRHTKPVMTDFREWTIGGFPLFQRLRKIA